MTLPRRYLDRMLAAAMLSALVTPSAALAARQTYTAPKFPVPASARVQPTTGGTAVAPAGTTVAPTSKATVPQTSTIPATPPPAVTTTPAGGVRVGTAKPAAGSGKGSSEVSTPALLAAALAALLALACAIWGAARLQAFEPRWTLSLRHTLAEAGFRASATWAEFSDWARLGR
ncbi:MAG TPA: hypothetical protein VFY36_10220 [Solirubrobacteraceae bacterium]|nr:hypothetical protein [Solirubrobacteraceae bacterium]